MDKNIVLIGFMGSGKTMIAHELGRRLKVKVVSTDDLAEAREGRSVLQIFETKGEAYFRDLEAGIVREIARGRGQVIDCGGGVVLCKENLPNLKANGIVFYLQAAPEVIYERVKHETHRPLLKSPDPLGCIKTLYQQRLPLYNLADYTIDANDASVEGPVNAILKKI